MTMPCRDCSKPVVDAGYTDAQGQVLCDECIDCAVRDHLAEQEEMEIEQYGSEDKYA